MAKQACVALGRCIGPPFLQNENITVNVICPAFIMTSLCPPKIREIFPKEQITHMSTALRAYDMFLDNPTLTSQIAELSIDKVIFRKQIEYANENQRWMLEDALKVCSRLMAINLSRYTAVSRRLHKITPCKL
jgi:NAD(P)-dependent dehydrogenase (short-subunit alcohol dehydrogenase family)